MWHHILICLPILGAILDVAGVLSSQMGRVLFLVVFIAGLIGAIRHASFKFSPDLVRSAVLSLIGAVLTFILSTKLELGVVVASALVGLVGAQVFKGRDQLVLYLGVFVGMGSVLSFASLIVAGLLGGLFFELTGESWVGVGGRLGTLAAASVLVVLAAIGGV